ncbi:MAG TPA: hypothetical protein VKW77_05120, partial [Acidimicrobiales bacterium]|nr:hypothetical protein [Acidimicrobiales bacterium]
MRTEHHPRGGEARTDWQGLDEARHDQPAGADPTPASGCDAQGRGAAVGRRETFTGSGPGAGEGGGSELASARPDPAPRGRREWSA